MKRVVLTALAMATLYVPGFALAAERLMEEVVVTATKREESIQDVPIAVSAFAGEDLDSRGVVDLYGLQEVSPSISVYSSNSTSNGGTVRIRGVGTTGNNPGLEAAVGTFIDGVYRSRAGQAFSDMVDIERVEILRGPQGTLFGKNTSAGALQIITKKPEFESGGEASVSVGDYGAIRGHVVATGPLSDTIAYRAALQYHERDGFYENDINGEAYDSRDRYTFKGQLLFVPSDTFESRLIFDYTDKDEDCCPANYKFVNLTDQGPSATTRGILNLGEPSGALLNEFLADLGRPAEVPENDDLDVGVNFEPFEEVEDWGVQNQASWQINEELELVSITAYREFEVSRGQDIDFSGADLLQPQFTEEKFENFSQELQLTWSTEKIDWLVGAYFYSEDIDSNESIRLASQGPEFLSRYITGLAAPGGLLAGALVGAPFGTVRGATPIGSFDNATRTYVSDGTDRANYEVGDGYFADFEQETRGWSIFTREVFHLTDKWDLTIGLRYSNEKKEATTRINGVDPINGSERDLLAAMLANTFNEDHCTGLVFIGSFCNLVSWSDEETEKEWSGVVTLGYALTEDVNVYATYSRGYKAGGFNLDQQAIEMDSFATYLATGGNAVFLDPTSTNTIPQEVLDATGGTGQNGLTQFACGSLGGVTNPVRTTSPDVLDCAFFDDDHRFDPEFVDSYELGLKAELLEGDLITNIAVFYSDFEDFQLNTFTGTGFLISNTEEMISKGVELESTWFLSDNLMWTFGVTYADARYGEDLNADTTELQLFLDQDFSTLEDFNSLENIEGRRITHAPLWQGSTSLFAQHEIGRNMVAYGNLNVGYRGEHNTGSDLNPIKDVSGKAVVNLQLGLRSSDDRWDAQLWARNLTDNRFETVVFNSVLQGGSFSSFRNSPRMWGLTVKTNW